MSIYDEFDDVVRHPPPDGPYVSSKKAHAEIVRLASEYNLTFNHNPGGGACYNPKTNGDYQISTYDDVEDLAILRKALGVA